MKQPIKAIPHAPQLGPQQLGRCCLVTGGSGYLGQAIVRRLREAGCEVRSFDVIPHPQSDGVETIVGDLRDYTAVRAACEGVHSVFHTAALINTLSIYRPSVRKRVFAVNVDGTRNVARAAVEAGATVLVHTSSFNVALSRHAPPREQDETMPYATHAKDLYSLSKIAAECAALGADRAGGLRVCALRPGGIWGSDTDSMMIRSFLEQLAAGKLKVLVGDPHAQTDNTYLDNLVDAQLLAAQALRARPHVAGGQAYNITDGEPMNGMTWFRPLVEGLGFPFPQTWLPLWLIRGVARLLETAHLLGAPQPLLTLRGVNNLAESSRLSIAKARRDLGYCPRYQQSSGMSALLPVARAFIASRRTAA